MRRSLDLRSWEAASELIRGWEASGEVGIVKPEVPTVAEAVTKFIEDTTARHLAGETVRKYKNLLERRFLGWCETKGFRLLKQIDVGAMREFRTTWDDGAVYATKNLERNARVLPVLRAGKVDRSKSSFERQSAETQIGTDAPIFSR